MTERRPFKTSFCKYLESLSGEEAPATERERTIAEAAFLAGEISLSGNLENLHAVSDKWKAWGNRLASELELISDWHEFSEASITRLYRKIIKEETARDMAFLYLVFGTIRLPGNGFTVWTRRMGA